MQQLREAFPSDSAPRYLLRDRDQIFGQDFVQQVKVMGIQQVLSAPRSPWQRAYVERLIGWIRRECLDHLIVLGERSLRRALKPYASTELAQNGVRRGPVPGAFCGARRTLCASYYHAWRTRLSLTRDAPRGRPA